MEDIHTLCYNNFGIAFQWKQNIGKNTDKIQLVFRETGLFLAPKELVSFRTQIQSALLGRKSCGNCSSKNTCRSILLETPIANLNFAFSVNELKLLDHLIEGTLFQLNLNRICYANGIH